MLRAVALFVCGKSLWFGSKWLYRYTVMTIVMTLASMVCVTWLEYRTLVSDPTVASVTKSLSWNGVRFILRESGRMTPLVACLGTSLVFQRTRSQKRHFHTSRWVVLAAVWCLAVAFVEPLGGAIGYAFEYYATPFHMQSLAPFVYSLPVLLTSLLLLRASFLARSAALIVAAVGVVVAAESAYTVPWLVNMAIHALNLSASGYPGGLPYSWVHTREEFLGVFVQSVALVGPWLLIAVHARFVPMQAPLEDGSPYPRRYCGRCFYNLYGLEADHCPECGRALRSE